MAIVAPFRAPQPKAWYPFPSFVANDGLSRGWSFQTNLAYLNAAFGAAAFGAANAFGIPVRYGRNRGVLAYLVPPIPPGPG